MHNVLTEMEGPTAHAKRNIEDPESAFLCLLDKRILEYICDCTVAEAYHREEGTSWKLRIHELKAFIVLLYVKGASERIGRPDWILQRSTEINHKKFGTTFYGLIRPRLSSTKVMKRPKYGERKDLLMIQNIQAHLKT